MEKGGSPTRSTGLKPDIKIVTTHPNGESVKRYREILEERIRNHNPHNQSEGSLEIEVSQYGPEQIVKAVFYAGLQADEKMEEKEMLEFLGKDSDYALVINKVYGEMALFIDGESYPLRPKKSLEETVEFEETSFESGF